jgi:hypothetical protein
MADATPPPPPLPPPPGTPSPPTRKVRPSGSFIAAMVIAGVLVVGGIIAAIASGLDETDGGSGSSEPVETPEGNTLTGSLEAPECGGGYDITFATVEVRDESNKLIGSSTTGVDTLAGTGCVVEFTIQGLPEADFYQIEIGTHGGPSYTFEELETANWDIELTLD